MKHVVITGVSSGMGHATAEELIGHGYHVFGSVRQAADAAKLQNALGQNFTPLLFDVTDEAAINAAAGKVGQALNGQGLAGLVNNAGIARPGPLMHLPLAKLREQFEVNVVGVMAVTQAFLPLLGARLPQTHPPGRIVNIGSVGGRIAVPFLGAYVGSKFAIEGLSDALRRELMIYGIDVIVLEPGTVRTDIWDKAEQEGIAIYTHTDFFDVLSKFQKDVLAMGRAGMSPSVIGRTIRHALESPRPKTRYALPDNYLVTWLLPRLLPDRWVDRLVAAQIGLKRKK